MGNAVIWIYNFINRRNLVGCWGFIFDESIVKGNECGLEDLDLYVEVNEPGKWEKFALEIRGFLMSAKQQARLVLKAKVNKSFE